MGNFVIEIHGVGWKGEERRGEKKKSPQGYEDNASLDKFCKIKGKKRKKRNTSVGQLQRGCGGEENFTTRAPGFDIIHDLGIAGPAAPDILEKIKSARVSSVPIFARADPR